MFAFKPHLFPLSLPLPLAEALQRGIPPFRASQNLLQTRHSATFLLNITQSSLQDRKGDPMNVSEWEMNKPLCLGFFS